MKARLDPDAGLILVTALLENDDEVTVLRLALDTGANFTVLTPQVFENMSQNVPPALEITPWQPRMVWSKRFWLKSSGSARWAVRVPVSELQFTLFPMSSTSTACSTSTFCAKSA